jgi:uncharacterized membrane protein
MLEDRRSRVAWLAAVVVPIVVVGVGSVVRPELFYDRFFWKYFFGPVVADFQGTRLTRNGVTVSPGYTVVSSGVYAYYLLLAVIGGAEFLDRLEVGDSPGFFFALVPYGLLGGAARVVEDAGALSEPFAYFFISPVIYFTIFFFAVAFFLVGVRAERDGVVDGYEKVVAGAGTAAFVAIAAYLVYFGVTETDLTVWIPTAVVGASTVVFAAIWFPLGSLLPEINRGTGAMGAVLLWAHLTDAFSTVVGVEYLGYSEKQPIVDTVITVTGTTYSFVVVKSAIVLLILYAFDEMFFEEFDRLPYLLLVAVLAVGLGPGTRNTLRMTLGI